MADPLIGRIVLNLFSKTNPAGSFTWKPLRAGVDVAILYGGDEQDPAAALLRYAPGAEVPLHEHRGIEHILILEGSQSDEFGEYGPGALVVSPPGTRHAVVSKTGCLVLAVWQAPVKFL